MALVGGIRRRIIRINRRLNAAQQVLSVSLHDPIGMDLANRALDASVAHADVSVNRAAKQDPVGVIVGSGGGGKFVRGIRGRE